jgi:hypothetical protein
MTPLGLPLENCNDRNETVTAHFSGAVTLSENWSVEVESGFSLPGEIEIGLDVKTSFEKGKEIQMAQGFDYPIPPDTKVCQRLIQFEDESDRCIRFAGSISRIG